MKNGANLSSNIPLIVDLDHTLVDTDLLYESSIAVLKKSLLFFYSCILIGLFGGGGLFERPIG